MKKSVIVKLLFNESCIIVCHGFTVQLYKLAVSLPKPRDATSVNLLLELTKSFWTEFWGDEQKIFISIPTI